MLLRNTILTEHGAGCTLVELTTSTVALHPDQPFFTPASPTDSAEEPSRQKGILLGDRQPSTASPTRPGKFSRKQSDQQGELSGLPRGKLLHNGTEQE